MKVLRFALVLFLSVMFLAVACEEEEEGPTPEGSPAAFSAEDARDAALEFAAESRFAGVSIEGLDWEISDLTPPGLVGAADLQYDAEGWRVLVSYPVVAQPTYGIGIERLETGENWKGRMTSQGEVQETGFIDADGALTVEGVLSAFPEGAEFDDLLLTDDSQEYGIEGATPEVEESIAEFIKAAVRVRVTGQLRTEPSDVEGRQIQVESIETTVPMPTMPAE